MATKAVGYMSRPYGTQLLFCAFYPGLKPGATIYGVPTELKTLPQNFNVSNLRVNY